MSEFLDTPPSVSEPSFNFMFVPGSWHGAWFYSPIIAALTARGHYAFAVNLPTNQPQTNFEDHTRAIVQALEGHQDVIGVFHSRAGNLGPRVAQHVGTSVMHSIAYVASSFEPSTLQGALEPEAIASLPARNSDGFRLAITTNGSLTEFDPKLAKEFFYHDCPEYVVPWAVGHLEPQVRADSGPPLDTWPDDRRQVYFECEDDRIVRSRWGHAVTDLLGIDRRTLPTGHSPFLADPEGTAEALIAWAMEGQQGDQAVALPRQRMADAYDTAAAQPL